jgi:uncharacterized protein (DUF2252 family)
MRSIVKSTKAFEAWMRDRTDVSEKMLEKKHDKMSQSAFPFLRATFYRWVEQWPAVCPKLAGRDHDVLLAVGDLHVENFGVWRDSRQRTIWGVSASCRSRAIWSGWRPARCWRRRPRESK